MIPFLSSASRLAPKEEGSTGEEGLPQASRVTQRPTGIVQHMLLGLLPLLCPAAAGEGKGCWGEASEKGG